MKILIKKDVISGQDGWRREGEIHDLEPKLANHYIKRGIGVIAEEVKEVKEEKVKVETKEAKAPKKRATKKAK
jgi:hypothetical protein